MNFDLSSDETPIPSTAVDPSGLPSEEGVAVDLTREAGQVVKTIVRAGGGELPGAESVVCVNYVARVGDGSGPVFDTTEELGGNGLEFTLSTGAVVVGLEMAVRSMRPGERSYVMCSPEFGYGATGKPPEVPAGAVLHFDVNLVSFRPREKQPWEIGPRDNFQCAFACRERGNELVRSGDHAGALVEYHRAIAHLDAVAEAASPQWAGTVAPGGADEGQGAPPAATGGGGGGSREANPLSPDGGFGVDPAEWRSAIAATLLNLALCQHGLGAHADAEESCTRALALGPASAKALFRRARARDARGDAAGAVADLEAARALEPGNRSLARELQGVRARKREERQQEREVARAMFAQTRSRGEGGESPASEMEVNPNSPSVSGAPGPAAGAPATAALLSRDGRAGSGSGAGRGSMPPAAQPGAPGAPEGVLLRRRVPREPGDGGAHASAASVSSPIRSARGDVCCGCRRCCGGFCAKLLALANPLWWVRLYASVAAAVLRRVPVVGPLAAQVVGDLRRGAG